MPQTERNRNGGNRNREQDMNQEQQGTQQKRPGTQQQGLNRDADKQKKTPGRDADSTPKR